MIYLSCECSSLNTKDGKEPHAKWLEIKTFKFNQIFKKTMFLPGFCDQLRARILNFGASG
jgi:hypothetical protein